MKNKMMFICILFLSVILICSCSDELEKKVIGTWTIDQLTYKNKESYTDLLSNMISFKKGNDCSLPIVSKEDNKNGKWHIEVKNDIPYLNIIVENNELKGIYKMSFKKDESSKLLKLMLDSDEIEFTCSKMLYNYDRDKDF